MNLESITAIELALSRVGDQLAFERQRLSVVVLGGAALNLLGLVSRATSDVDIIAFANEILNSSDHNLMPPPDPLPQALKSAIAAVANDMGLDPRWMNTVAALQWSQGLPTGLGTRLSWRHYGPPDAQGFGLDVGLVSRFDLIFCKLYAAVDAVTTRSVHYKDLIALAPTDAELDAAADWLRPQNASQDFHVILDELVGHLKRQVRDFQEEGPQ